MIEDWWAEPVKAIYNASLAALDGDDMALDSGPGHICWADGNFDDGNVSFCLGECESRREEWIDKFGLRSLEVAREALQKLMRLPEPVRDCDPFDDESQ